MSRQAQGFVRNSRFGSGQVIPGTNRETTRKWRALGIPEAPIQFASPGICERCGKGCCVCPGCLNLKGGALCWECSQQANRPAAATPNSVSRTSEPLDVPGGIKGS